MRWSIGTPVVVVVDGKHAPCLLRDISASGAAINIGIAAKTGDPAVLLVSKACSIPSEIVRVSAVNSGLEFKGTSPNDRMSPNSTSVHHQRHQSGRFW